MRNLKKTRLFRSGGSYAVRIPRDWVPASGDVILRREGRDIIISEAGAPLRDLADKFARDGRIAFERPAQPKTPEGRKL
jgi:virulence-associated protein VagC